MTEEEDLEWFAGLAATVVADLDDESEAEWVQSPFLSVKQISAPATRGKVGQEVVIAWARELGFEVSPRRSTDHDTVIDGCLVEVKFSLRWQSGEFVFQQIRDQDYEVAALLGFAPFRPYLWFVPKDILIAHSERQQADDNRWLRFPASSPPAWLNEWGGSPSAARGALERARKVSEPAGMGD